LSAAASPDEPGSIRERVTSNEAQPPPRLSGDDLIRVLIRVTEVASRARVGTSLLEGFLRELIEVFPAATKGSLLLIECSELVVRMASPEPSTVSFSLARDAVRRQEAFRWQRGSNSSDRITQLDTLAAIYAPMLCGGQPAGVIALASHRDEHAFTEDDLQLLSVLANTMGPA
jgi:hypothetical protein